MHVHAARRIVHRRRPHALPARETPSGSGTAALGRIARGTVVTGKGKRRRSVLVITGTTTTKRAGAASVGLALTAAGRKTLRVGRTTKVTFRVTFTPKGGTKTTVSRTIGVKLRR